ncbi:L-2-amino-thiazoline-4-carboxylic acid hydrolase [uncultured Clostridium sp.]|nr:L-2-amino-thiazoline-4-carboxylic acid hydrolase [uncultured Clostridium sp.]
MELNLSMEGTVEDGQYQPKNKWYIRQVKQYNRLLRKLLVDDFSREALDKIFKDTLEEFKYILPTIPCVDQKENPNTQKLVIAAYFLTLYKFMKEQGVTPVEMGKIVYDVTVMKITRIPKILRWAKRKNFFSEKNIEILQKLGIYSKSSRNNDEFVFDVKIKDEGELCVTYRCCPIIKYYMENGGEELAPYVCTLDIAIGKVLGTGVKVSKTIGWGNSYCDFSYKEGREVNHYDFNKVG